jgi:Rv0078B-related antitoxin
MQPDASESAVLQAAMPTGVGHRAWPPRVEVIDDETAEMYRRMSPSQRVRACLEMYDFAWQIVANSIRDKEPGIDDAELRRRVNLRMQNAG